MAKMETKEVFDLYFGGIDYDTARKVRPQVDRPEVYAYEAETGKQIFDMDVDELTDMILKFNNERVYGKNTFAISYGTVDQVVSTFRSIWNYYIDNIDIIRNPWNDKRMRGTALAKRISATKKPFTYAIVDDAIKRLHRDYEINSYTPNYIECLLLLFYNGFAEAREIVNLKEDMIDFDNHVVHLDRTDVKLSDRCFELLQYVHNLDEIESEHGNYTAVSYHGGYFKFVVRPREAGSFNEKDQTSVGAILTRKITMCVRKAYGIDINYRVVYMLGFYEYIVKQVGEDETKRLITSVRNSDDANEITRLAGEYGFVSDNVTYIKKCLRPFM